MKAMLLNKGVVGVTVPAGEYWLGDPSYSIKGKHWERWLERSYAKNDHTYAILAAKVMRDYWALGLGTAHGDGCFMDQHGNQYGVDSGMIGLVPVAYNPTTNYTLDENGVNEYGVGGIARKVTFDVGVECRNDNGFLRFGDILIDTR